MAYITDLYGKISGYVQALQVQGGEEQVDVDAIAGEFHTLKQKITQQEKRLRGMAGILSRIHGLPTTSDEQEEDGTDRYKLKPLERAWLKQIEEGKAEMSFILPEQDLTLGGMPLKGHGTIKINPSKGPTETKDTGSPEIPKDMFRKPKGEEALGD